uniref:Uncharacterized protein n=1 Tax=Chromera velia CCMP2878 TaxID=1169474 RepID=A0A0G4GSL6_9ALVE|eukprot:Cvel_23155.t1-p1 / transcript=Cvel_23155.t1 / gene=Cvel_23155 / organism=Chromera_velia_CCMP2878 / gene_product=hypothetical protein / transcript_product=hypothetical protein / location=Cvel_scaffold2355:14603-15376(+) / protein_length=258 / sequence_SO=supercontig / SO=protein_coding / is_pseudo=false
MKCAGVSDTDLKTYTSNFISKMLFIPDMSISDKVYQYEKGLPEDVQKEVKRKKSANLGAAVGAVFEALSIVPHLSVSFTAAATHPRTLSSTEAPPMTVGEGHISHDPIGSAPIDISALRQTNRSREHNIRKLPPLTDKEKEILREFHGCFLCRTLHTGHGVRDCPDRNIIIIQKPREGANGRGPKHLSFGYNSDETSDIWGPEGQPKMVRATLSEERSDDEWVHRPSGMYHIEGCECSEGRDGDGEEEDEFANSPNRH